MVAGGVPASMAAAELGGVHGGHGSERGRGSGRRSLGGWVAHPELQGWSATAREGTGTPESGRRVAAAVGMLRTDGSAPAASA